MNYSAFLSNYDADTSVCGQSTYGRSVTRFPRSLKLVFARKPERYLGFNRSSSEREQESSSLDAGVLGSF